MPGSVLLVSWLLVLIQLVLVSQLPGEPTGLLYHDESTAAAVRFFYPPTLVALVLIGLVVVAVLVWPPLLLADAVASRWAGPAFGRCVKLAVLITVTAVLDTAACAAALHSIRQDSGRSLDVWVWLTVFAVLPLVAGTGLLFRAITEQPSVSLR